MKCKPLSCGRALQLLNLQLITEQESSASMVKEGQRSSEEDLWKDKDWLVRINIFEMSCIASNWVLEFEVTVLADET